MTRSETDLEVELDSASEESETPMMGDKQIYDFITNQPVKDSPTEQSLQTVAKSLVYEYGFEHTQLARDYTVVYEVVSEDGKRKKVTRTASVAIFPEEIAKTDQQKIIRVCVIQAPGTKGGDAKRGISVLEDIMGTLSKCEYGLWTNGTDLVFKQKVTGGGRLQPDYEDLYDLPGNGETIKDLDRPERPIGRIATGDNLQRTFARVHDYIYGNQGLKKDAAFWQVLNLIFCKIHDERSTGKRRFWVKGTERNDALGQAAIAKRIKDLFKEVKDDPSYSSVFSDRDSIELNDRVLAYVVGELSRYTLSDTDVDVKGAAYEEITSSMLKAQRGQFFTPTNIIRAMVAIMDPGGDEDLTDAKNWPRILDPACGSGRFLTYTLDHIRRKIAVRLFPDEHPLLQSIRLEKDEQAKQLVRKFASECLYGIDFDPDLKRAARMNMILNNDGHGNILSFNSLEYPLMIKESKTESRRAFGKKPEREWPDPVRARLDADVGTFDFVFTNPPFGAKIPIDDPNILRQFDLAHIWSQDFEGRWFRTDRIQRHVAPEVLFVERCVQWAKPGTGKVAIVLPDSILGNADAAYIRYWIFQHCQVLASVDLPVEAFLPQVGVQASLLFLRRKSDIETDSDLLSGKSLDYTVFMAVAESVGHDRRGSALYKRDEDGAEVIRTESRDVLRQVRGRRIASPGIFREKEIDDDLPQIVIAWKQYCSTKSTVP